MVVIHHCTPDQLIAYSTIPVTANVSATVQNDFAIGSFARFHNPLVTVSIHDRPDFHNKSHYQMREQLDLEGLLDRFLVIDHRTATASPHTIWYVETTEVNNIYTADAIASHDPPVTHEGESSTIWHGRFVTQDVPLQWACFFAAVRDLRDDILPYLHPYDPHNPQDDPFTFGVDFSTKEGGAAFVGDAYLTAQYDEVEWSTDIVLRRKISLIPPVVVRLTTPAAREAGLLRVWMPYYGVPRVGQSVETAAPYDWDSPNWGLNLTSVLKTRSLRPLSLVRPGIEGDAGTCRGRNVLGMAGGGLSGLFNSSGVHDLLVKNKANVSRTLSEMA